MVPILFVLDPSKIASEVEERRGYAEQVFFLEVQIFEQLYSLNSL